MRGLPPDASVWREDALPPAEELLALLVEQQDAWHEAGFLLAAGKRVRQPGRVRIRRPGEDVQERKIVSDPLEIRAWFAKHAGRG